MTIKSFVRKLIPGFVLSIYHYKLALLGALIYGFPSRKLIIIGVSGTSGKSTTVDLITKILERSGEKVASISTIRFKIANKEWKNNLKMTMPGRFKIQKFLRQAVNAGCKYVVLEVASEGVKQSRHKFIKFDSAVFTNLSPEHIESHGGFEKYRKAKLKFFKAVKNKHFINIDDENAKYFIEIKAKEIIKFSLGDVKNLKVDESGSSFQLQDTKFQIQLMGQFNVYNALCAICVANSYGVSLDVCKDALEKAKGIEGRMEVVVKNPFTVIVDYAHTPEQLENVYKTLNPRPLTLDPKLICVLGSCGGGRDKWKRPVLGEIASRYCNQIILTNEDPYDEDPDEILAMIKSGVLKAGFSTNNLYEIIDRKMAIRKSLELAEPNDIVIITGKGCESSICLAKGERIPWR